MLQKLRTYVHAINARRELKWQAPHLNHDAAGLGSEALVNLLYSARWERFFWTKQVKAELIGLAAAVERIKPKVVVEIGTNTGGTFFVFTKVADKAANIISIDLPGGKGGGGYPEFKTDFFRSFGIADQRLHFIKAASQLPETYDRVRSILQDQPIDFLFIDGDHSYDGVKKDFELYSPLVRKGGLVAFHDIKLYPEDHWIKVDKFWREIKDNYQHFEYIDNRVHWGGIGLLVMK
ncbi:MAG: class I SAM-dependent methyltransferase [Bacteroidota bacterium]